ncbi:MAG: hypothetical protein AAB544_01965, partial [Patescibacteria group bacterium]
NRFGGGIELDQIVADVTADENREVGAGIADGEDLDCSGIRKMCADHGDALGGRDGIFFTRLCVSHENDATIALLKNFFHATPMSLVKRLKAANEDACGEGNIRHGRTLQ